VCLFRDILLAARWLCSKYIASVGGQKEKNQKLIFGSHGKNLMSKFSPPINKMFLKMFS
jgi:hypothetical protein